jgi:hypothetical protein
VKEYRRLVALLIACAVVPLVGAGIASLVSASYCEGDQCSEGSNGHYIQTGQSNNKSIPAGPVQNPSKNRTQEPDDQDAGFSVIIGRIISWLERDIKSTDVAVAFFTLGLVLVGIRQVDIYSRQAKIMRRQVLIQQQTSDLEWPRLFIIILSHNLGEIMSSPSARLYESHPTVSLSAVPTVKFALRNYGRSPAIIFCIQTKVDKGRVPPREDVPYPYKDVPNGGIVDYQETSAGVSAFANPLGTIRRSEFEGMLGGETYWWLFGTVGFNDVWDGENTLHFCWRYNHGDRIFEPYPRSRNYTEQRGRRHDPPPP